MYLPTSACSTQQTNKGGEPQTETERKDSAGGRVIGTYLKLDVASTERVDALLENLVLGLGLFGLSSSLKQLRRLLVCDTNNNKRSVMLTRTPGLNIQFG
jgi:hypothetical protein